MKESQLFLGLQSKRSSKIKLIILVYQEITVDLGRGGKKRKKGKGIKKLSSFREENNSV